MIKDVIEKKIKGPKDFFFNKKKFYTVVDIEFTIYVF
jgi:hypothetical protein